MQKRKLDYRSVNKYTIARIYGTLSFKEGAYAFCQETKVHKSY